MKQEFDFYIDEKVTIWNRFKFSVEAETLDEAKEKAKIIAINEREDFDFDDSLFLHDTMETIEPEENDGNSTLELFCKIAIEKYGPIQIEKIILPHNSFN